MKFTHNGQEFEVAELINAIRVAIDIGIDREHRMPTLELGAAAALLARCEREREALEEIVRMRVGLDLTASDAEWRTYWADRAAQYRDIARTALRATESEDH